MTLYLPNGATTARPTPPPTNNIPQFSTCDDMGYVASIHVYDMHVALCVFHLFLLVHQIPNQQDLLANVDVDMTSLDMYKTWCCMTF